MRSTFSTHNRDFLVGGILVVLVIIVQTFAMGIAIIFLSIGLVAGFILWVVESKRVSKPDIIVIYFIAVGVQCIHFLEEFLTGFQTEFPQLFGYTWSDNQFFIFNLLWIAVFIFNGIGIYYNIKLSYLLVYFLVLVGGIANGLAHPLLSLMKGGYFPGLFTSVMSLVVGLVFMSKLVKDPKRHSNLP